MAVPVNADFIANLDRVNALADFVYRNEGHREIMRRRKEWFDRMEFHLAMWWVPAGSRRNTVPIRPVCLCVSVQQALPPAECHFNFRTARQMRLIRRSAAAGAEARVT